MIVQGRIRIFVEVIQETDAGATVRCRQEIHPMAFKMSRLPLGNIAIEECLQALLLECGNGPTP